MRLLTNNPASIGEVAQGVKITLHRLRHTFATPLLNTDVPIPVLQKLLGYENIKTTLQYTRLYDSTIAADYYRAMNEIEGRLGLGDDLPNPPPSSGELLAMLDALKAGTLNESQQEIVQTLRSAILAIDANTALGDEGDDDYLPRET